MVVNYASNSDAVEEVVNTIGKGGGQAYAHQCDVSQEDQVQAMFKRMIETFGTIDVLVNNAGLQRDAPFDQMSLEQWNTVLSLNLTG